MINRSTIINYIRKYEIVIASAVVLLTLIGATFLFLLPSFTKAKLIFEQKSQLQKKFDKLQQKYNALSDLDSKYYQGALSRFYRIIPDGKDYVSLFETLDGLDKKANVKISKAGFQLGSLTGGVAKLKKSQGASAYILPITIYIQGNYTSVEKYLEALSDLTGRIITIDSITIGTDNSGIYNLSLSGNTFVVPVSETIGSLDAPIPKINNTQQELLDKIAKIKIDTFQSTVQEKIPVGKKSLFD